MKKNTANPPADSERARLQEKTAAVNEQLIAASARQQELTEAAEKKRQENESLFRTLYEALPVAVFVCNRDAVIQNYNRRAAELWGREPECGVEQHCGSMKLILPDGSPLPHEQSPMMEVLRTGTACRNVEVFIQRPDDSRIPVIVNFCALKDAPGEIIGVVTSFDDISERKEAEEKLRERTRLSALRAEISGALVSGETLPVVLQKCAEAVVNHLDAAFARIWTLKETENVLELQASAGLYTHLNGPHGRVKVGEFKIGRIAKSTQPLLTNDVLNDTNISDPEWAKREGMVAFAGYPLILENRVLGVLALFARHPLSETVLNELAPIADGIAQWVQRKQAEEALRESRERLQAALDGSGAGSFRWNIQSNALEWDENLDRLFGLPPGRTIRSLENFISTIHPDERAGVIERCERCARDGTDFKMEFRVIWPDGSVHWLDDQGTTVRDDAGKPHYMTGMCLDITERKTAEKKLRAAAERLRFMAESMPQKIFTAKPDGNIDYFNRQWMEFTGLSFEQIRDWGWTQFIHPDDVEENIRCWKHSVESGDYFELEHRFRRNDGEYRWHLSRAQAMRDAEGKIVIWIGSNTDIDDQKRAEEKLELTVAERTADLKETNEQLEAFVYSIAHDLRAPLRSMQGFSQMLIDDYAASLDETARNFLERINHSSEFMDKMIMDLLSFGRAGRAEIELKPISVQAAWDSALFQCAKEIEQTDAQIETATPLPSVRANEATLTQILANLLSNGMKFMPQDTHPKIRFWAEDCGPAVRLWLEDNGVGIPPEQHERIFRVFERLNGARFPGTGIGLSIVRKGVNRMDGKVGLESAPGKGSQFWIELQKA
ncbi:MAG: PAS domain S-box protein [Verrucomicrobiota bacterium]